MGNNYAIFVNVSMVNVLTFSRDSDLEMTDNEEEFHYTELDNTSQSINTMTKSFAALHTSSPLDLNHKSFTPAHRHSSAENMTSASGGTGTHVKAIHDSRLSDGGVFDHDYQIKVRGCSNIISHFLGDFQLC